MAQHPQDVTIDHKVLKNAEALWDNFIKLSKLSILGVSGILFALWFFFIAL